MKKFYTLSLIITLLFSTILTTEQNSCFANSSQVSQISLMKSFKDVSHKIWVINKMNTLAKNLPDSNKNIITKYVYGAVRGEETFLLINCYLRGNLNSYVPAKEITTPLKHRLKYYAEQLSGAVGKVTLPRNMILYRGVDEKAIKSLFSDKNINSVITKPVTEENLAVLKQKLTGAKFNEKGFMSTSYDKNCAKQTKFMYEVYAPKGLQAVLIESFGKKSEKEVLINRDTKWEIKNITIGSDKKTGRNYYVLTIKYVIK